MSDERTYARMWPVVLLLIVLVQFVSLAVIDSNGRREREALKRDDAAMRTRLDNELRTLLWASQSGTAVPTDGELTAIPVKPWNLVESFIGDGGYAYAGRKVVVPVSSYAADGVEWLWYVGSDRKAPALVFRFDAPQKPGRRAWVEGRVVGKEQDGALREHPQVDFRVVLVDCKIVGD